MSVPQDPTHPKAFEGDDVEGHMAVRRITEDDASVAEETSDVEGHMALRSIIEADAEVEQPDDDVEGHGRSSG